MRPPLHRLDAQKTQVPYVLCRTSKMSHDRSGHDLWLCTDRDGCGRWLWRLVGLRNRTIREYRKPILIARAYARDNQILMLAALLPRTPCNAFDYPRSP